MPGKPDLATALAKTCGLSAIAAFSAAQLYHRFSDFTFALLLAEVAMKHLACRSCNHVAWLPV